MSANKYLDKYVRIREDAPLLEYTSNPPEDRALMPGLEGMVLSYHAHSGIYQVMVSPGAAGDTILLLHEDDFALVNPTFITGDRVRIKADAELVNTVNIFRDFMRGRTATVEDYSPSRNTYYIVVNTSLGTISTSVNDTEIEPLT